LCFSRQAMIAASASARVSCALISSRRLRAMLRAAAVVDMRPTSLVELTAAGLSRDRIVTLRQPAPPPRTEVRP